MSNAWASGSTRAHRRAREAVLVRDAALGYHCRAHEDGWCARANDRPHRCRQRPEQAHHTHGKAVTGDNPDHMVSSCQPCNLHIGSPEANADPEPRPRTKW